MIKTAILVLAGAGIIGTGSQAIAPPSIELSAGAIAYEVSTEGLKAKTNANPEFGITIVTKGNKQLTIRF